MPTSTTVKLVMCVSFLLNCKSPFYFPVLQAAFQYKHHQVHKSSKPLQQALYCHKQMLLNIMG